MKSFVLSSSSSGGVHVIKSKIGNTAKKEGKKEKKKGRQQQDVDSLD